MCSSRELEPNDGNVRCGSCRPNFRTNSRRLWTISRSTGSCYATRAVQVNNFFYKIGILLFQTRGPLRYDKSRIFIAYILVLTETGIAWTSVRERDYNLNFLSCKFIRSLASEPGSH